MVVDDLHFAARARDPVAVACPRVLRPHCILFMCLCCRDARPPLTGVTLGDGHAASPAAPRAAIGSCLRGGRCAAPATCWGLIAGICAGSGRRVGALSPVCTLSFVVAKDYDCHASTEALAAPGKSETGSAEQIRDGHATAPPQLDGRRRVRPALRGGARRCRDWDVVGVQMRHRARADVRPVQPAYHWCAGETGRGCTG